MDEQTRKFVDGCLSDAAKDIDRHRNDEAFVAQLDERVAQIRVNASAALERLEVGQVTAARSFKGARYMG